MKKNVNQDFVDFLNILNKHKVEYCIVGGYAVAFYAQPRYTKDLDICVTISNKNAKKIVSALKEYGISEPDINENLFMEKGKILRFGVPPNRIEILNDIDGVKPENISVNKIKGNYGNVKTYYIGLNDLIKNKEVIMNKQNRKNACDINDYSILNELKNKKGRK